jgi:hypothetical protein
MGGGQFALQGKRRTGHPSMESISLRPTVTDRVEGQTNSLGVALGTNWVDHPGGTASPVTVPIDPQNRSVFYRLVWP